MDVTPEQWEALRERFRHIAELADVADWEAELGKEEE